VESNSIAVCGFAHLQRQYSEIIENKLKRSGAMEDFDLEITGTVSSGGGCLLSSFAVFASSANNFTSSLHSCSSGGFTTFQRSVSSSSASNGLSLTHFLNVSRRGKVDDANS
jgi:hypothetical protein